MHPEEDSVSHYYLCQEAVVNLAMHEGNPGLRVGDQPARPRSGRCSRPALAPKSSDLRPGGGFVHRKLAGGMLLATNAAPLDAVR